MKNLVFVLVFAFYANSASIPSYVKLCKRNDPDLSKCIINTFHEIRPYLKKGIPEMNIPPGDPISYYDLSGHTGEQKTLHFKATAYNQIATGLLDVEIKNITIDFDKPTVFLTLYFPFVMMTGDYNIDGKVLLFEIDSTGKFVLNNTNLEADVELPGNYIEKDGKKYLDFSVNLRLKPGTVSIYFSNLIAGNDLLTTTLNKAINENIKTLYEDLAPLLDEAFGGLAKEYFNDVFHLFPVSELFPED